MVLFSSYLVICCHVVTGFFDKKVKNMVTGIGEVNYPNYFVTSRVEQKKSWTSMSNTLANIRKELERLGDKEYATRLGKYFKTGKHEYGEGDRFLGIRVPDLRKSAKRYRNISINQASQLLRSSFHEERLFSLLVLVDLFKRATDQDKKKIYTLYLRNTKFINNWDLVDASAGRIVGAYLLTRDKKYIYALAKSKNLWERRISIMATSYFIGQNEFADTLKMAKMLLNDEEDLIHKSVGWLLREVGKKDFELEESFLKKHHASMPRTMLRYAIEKFPQEKRKNYLKVGRSRRAK